jgi:hypothetical protein
MRHNDYTDRYSFNAFKGLTSAEKSALLVQKMLPHSSDNFKELAKRGTLVAMMALYAEEREYGFLPFDGMTFNEWLDSEAVSLTNNERWAATPEQVKMLDERDEMEFEMGYNAAEVAADLAG